MFCAVWSFPASAVTHELLPYSEVGRAVRAQRLERANRADRTVLLTFCNTNILDSPLPLNATFSFERVHSRLN